MPNQTLISAALGLGHVDATGQLLDCYFPRPKVDVDQEDVKDLLHAAGFNGGNCTKVLETFADIDLKKYGFPPVAKLQSNQRLVATVIAANTPPRDIADAYLRLTLLSHRLKKPHGVDVTGIFKVLPNVCWTSEGPVAVAEIQERQLTSRLQGRPLRIWSVDKFPAMTDYVVPEGVRIADTARVRLGAYIGSGTTIMHEGFVNFNAGCDGPNMVEGRISAGVMVGKGSDLGGGCSTMGTLSGGGQTIISIGENCLIGANAGIGIPLGNGCTVEAGLYVTAGTKVQLIAQDGKPDRYVKARDLAEMDHLLFRRNSITGTVECLTRKSAIELNEELHAHN